MEERKQVRLMLTDDEAEIIEPIIERLNGLEELLMIIPLPEFEMLKNVENEIAVLERTEEELVSNFCKKRQIPLPSETVASIYCDLMEMTVLIESS